MKNLFFVFACIFILAACSSDNEQEDLMQEIDEIEEIDDLDPITKSIDRWADEYPEIGTNRAPIIEQGFTGDLESPMELSIYPGDEMVHIQYRKTDMYGSNGGKWYNYHPEEAYFESLYPIWYCPCSGAPIRLSPKDLPADYIRIRIRYLRHPGQKDDPYSSLWSEPTPVINNRIWGFGGNIIEPGEQLMKAEINAQVTIDSSQLEYSDYDRYTVSITGVASTGYAEKMVRPDQTNFLTSDVYVTVYFKGRSQTLHKEITHMFRISKMNDYYNLFYFHDTLHLSYENNSFYLD